MKYISIALLFGYIILAAPRAHAAQYWTAWRQWQVYKNNGKVSLPVAGKYVWDSATGYTVGGVPVLTTCTIGGVARSESQVNAQNITYAHWVRGMGSPK